jgi:hypothetical protein
MTDLSHSASAAILDPMRWLRPFARRRLYVLGLPALLSVVLAAVLTTISIAPHPVFHDEFSYLLAGQTFASGRLTNPPHPLWQHFETFQVLSQPTYMSKYPPAQGMALAVGIWLNDTPIVGVWLTTALACAAVAWALLAVLPPRWALLGGLLVAIHPLVLQWNNSYWGGSIALGAGALLIGSAVRLGRRIDRTNSAIFAIAIAILANTRPYEGLVLTLLVGLPLILAILRRPPHRATALRRALPVVVPILLLNFVWMGIYNHAVTGSAWRLPYVEYESQYAITPALIVLPVPPDKTYRHPVMEVYYRQWEWPQYEKQDTPAEWAGAFVEKVRLTAEKVYRGYGDWGNELIPTWVSLARLGIALPLLMLPVVLMRRNIARMAAGAIVVFMGFSFLALWFFPHYAAPIGVALVMIQVMLLRELWCAGRAARALVVLVLVSHAVDAGSSLLLIRDNLINPRFAPRIQHDTELRGDPRPWLVIVNRPGEPIAHLDWVFNGPDLLGDRVIYARSLGPERDAELIEFARRQGRRVGRIDTDGFVARWEVLH